MNNKLRDITANLQQKITPQTPRTRNVPSRRDLRSRSLPAKKTTLVAFKARRWKVPPGVVAVAAFASGLSFLAGGAWVSVQMIMNPDAIMGLNQFLPARNSIGINDRGEPPLPLSAIRSQLRQDGLIPGPILPLKSSKNPGMEPDLLLPVMVESPPPKHLLCQSPCQQISELRIYQPVSAAAGSSNQEQYLRLVAFVPVEGPPESMVLAEPMRQQERNSGSSRPQPLTAIENIQGDAPATGIWLNLTGHRRVGDNTIAYGQVFHYNPDRSHLAFMVQWASAANQMPMWQEVIGGGKPELVIDRSVGLEPSFEVYQVQPRNFVPNPIQLDLVSLAVPALGDTSYRQALQLAKGGLWSPALKMMQSLNLQRRQKGESWPNEAQDQMDIVQLHSKITKSQAGASWSEPGQKALAYIIDGRWEEALRIYNSDLENTYKISLMLKADKGSVAKRVEAALRVTPDRTAVKGWGAVLRAAQKGKAEAISWLKQEGKLANGEEAAKVNELLERLDVALSEAILVNHPGKLMGLAMPVAQMNPDQWWLPKQNSSLKLDEGEVWYEVRLAGFHDGQAWLRPPFADLSLPNIEPGRRLWRILGLNLDPQLQISVWMPDGTQTTTEATVKAVSFRKGVVQLLASGKPVPGAATSGGVPRPVAFTSNRFRWLEPTSLTLGELQQQQPVLVMNVLTSLWQELQRSGRLGAGAVPAFDQLLQQAGNWQVQLIDVNSNQLPDVVLSLRPDMYSIWQKPGAAASKGDDSRAHGLIFDDGGKLIYSEFSTNSGLSLTGFADLEDGGPVAVVVDSPSGYSLKRWVADGRRFD